jgi:CRISPR-associated exonuclease Cas4
MFSEEDLISLSALQHTMFCPRQCALIHLEQVWEENRFTAEGKVLHERVDEEHRERRKQNRTEYSLPLRSLEWGLIGVADVVEFTLGTNRPYEAVVPVEYKRGKAKEADVDRVQLCAQALCLEEMFKTQVPSGAFYYLQDHRRTPVDFTSELRQTTLAVVQETRALLASKITPRPVYEKAKCDRCSLADLCMPQAFGGGANRVNEYIRDHVGRSRNHA